MKATGSMGQYMSKMNKSPVNWINESTWKECLQLSATIPAFSGLCSNIAVNATFWNAFSNSDKPFKFLEAKHDTGKSDAGAFEIENGTRVVASLYLHEREEWYNLKF